MCISIFNVDTQKGSYDACLKFDFFMKTFKDDIQNDNLSNPI
jgi:hypothetical protein